MTLGERLREIRKEKDLTKQELGNTLNIPKDRIKLYESGEEIPSEFYLTAFAKHFNISVDELLILK
ncbi:transcriptional regulator with XRE-family HTH domain [Sedimentibacter acidaminivorans]|uniref:Transcriptional regulator with XRE-family HTH domain n=1 Tax=Sedimentibacter acidaminivorans TaxID=913099 RepID=A0ABS4GG49_9FIRM|nr:helix-turn-helix transcriptional regulator [Sedimentibacter acidaminivorans]MBP1926668.1 transcriptional regulator with XRE-family HTH domain [Sedimentibacter acidaminivorans]